MEQDVLANDLTRRIIGCAMEVHRALGNGFQEVIYQRALAAELGINRIHFAREFEMPIFYKELQVGSRRVDFLVSVSQLDYSSTLARPVFSSNVCTITGMFHLSQSNG